MVAALTSGDSVTPAMTAVMALMSGSVVSSSHVTVLETSRGHVTAKDWSIVGVVVSMYCEDIHLFGIYSVFVVG